MVSSVTFVMFYITSIKEQLISLFNSDPVLFSDIFIAAQGSTFDFFLGINDHYVYSEHFRVISLEIQNVVSPIFFSISILCFLGMFLVELIKKKRERNSFKLPKEEGVPLLLFFSMVAFFIMTLTMYFGNTEDILYKLDNLVIFSYIVYGFVGLYIFSKAYIYFDRDVDFLSRKKMQHLYLKLKEQEESVVDLKKYVFNHPDEMQDLLEQLNKYNNSKEKRIIKQLLEEFEEHKVEDNEEQYIKYSATIEKRFNGEEKDVLRGIEIENQ